MALLTFVDSTGQSWRVWNVERARPPESHTDFLEPEYRSGWLVFESMLTGERRRLAPIPAEWAGRPVDELERLCEQAVSTGRAGASALRRPTADAHDVDVR
jgi:hypothetical protein